MPRNITIFFDDGSGHRYENIPDNVTPDMIEARVKKDFANKRITRIDGGKKGLPSIDKPATASTSDSNQATDKEKTIAQNMSYYAREHIKSSLKDGESAKFKNIRVVKTKTVGLLCIGEVNAKNSFGAYTGYTSFVSNGKLSLLETQMDANEFAKFWNDNIVGSTVVYSVANIF